MAVWSSADLWNRLEYIFGIAPGSKHLEYAGTVLHETHFLQEQGSRFHWLEK